jgi:hypothetical protein
MPVAKIHVLEGRYDDARLGRVSNAVQQGLISALGIPPDDFFQIIHVLPRSRFRHTPSEPVINQMAPPTLVVFQTSGTAVSQ